MDITSPIYLWKDYDVSALPFNASELSPKTENDVTVKEYYFDGYTTVDGRARAFVRIYEVPDTRSVVLYLGDTDGNLNDPIIKNLLELGYSVAALDYLGKSDSISHYTMYPASLSNCNRRGEHEFAVNDSEHLSNWYIWTCVARRTVKFLKELYPEKNLFSLGIGLGGNTVYKLAVFDDGLTACATMLNILPTVSGEGNAIINYHASLDNIAYAPITKVPLFIAVASNDCDGSLDEMSNLVENSASIRRFRIVERAFSNGIYTTINELSNFFVSCADGEAVKPWPSITASNSDGSLYFNIDINRDLDTATDDTAKLELYVSFCIESAPFRNWMTLPTISLGKDKFIAKINVCQGDKPIYAFANFIYPNGAVKSSTVIGVIPKSLGVIARPGVSHRKIYDGSMGKDGWTSRFGGSVKLVSGPFDIDGITSEDTSLVTFKPGDPLFKVPADTLLQLMLSGDPQSVIVSVSDRTNVYSAYIELNNSGDWQTFSLSHMNFKGSAGTLSDWSQILMLEITSVSKLIVGSVLWV